MNIYIPTDMLFTLVFIAGLILGAYFHAKIEGFFKTLKAPIDYDGRNGSGYQPRPEQPKGEGARSKPPKPEYNPHK